MPGHEDLELLVQAADARVNVPRPDAWWGEMEARWELSPLSSTSPSSDSLETQNHLMGPRISLH